ncbi:hypothetical protein [Devosia submarina]|uniref:hypothetical protein n=1 Tax=Devosia submarina TaxID=1173082 RepID=UPI000D390184|nr:hypothetical protein [Devosia submarina]
MSAKPYILVSSGGRWWISFGSSRHGPFISKQIAIDAAIRLARVDFAVGRPARVLLDDKDGRQSVLYDSSH